LSGFPRRSETFALNEVTALASRGCWPPVFATKPGDGLSPHPMARALAPMIESTATGYGGRTGRRDGGAPAGAAGVRRACVLRAHARLTWPGSRAAASGCPTDSVPMRRTPRKVPAEASACAGPRRGLRRRLQHRCRPHPPHRPGVETISFSRCGPHSIPAYPGASRTSDPAGAVGRLVAQEGFRCAAGPR